MRAVGEDAVWVANLDDRTLSRIDPKTRPEPARTIPLDATPTGVAVGNGAVWVANGLLGTVSLGLIPGINSIAATVTGGPRSYTGSVAVGLGGVVAAFGNGIVLQINPRTAEVAGRGLVGFAPFCGRGRRGRSLGRKRGREHRLSAQSAHETEVKSISVGSRPSSVAVGGGSVWVASQGDDRVTRIDPATLSVTETITGRQKARRHRVRCRSRLGRELGGGHRFAYRPLEREMSSTRSRWKLSGGDRLRG